MHPNTSAETLFLETQWLAGVIEGALHLYFQSDPSGKDITLPEPPDFSALDTPYAKFCKQTKLSITERVALALCITPHIRPEILDPFLMQNQNLEKGYTEFGGIKGKYHSGFLPTGQTFIFLLTAYNPSFFTEALYTLSHKSPLRSDTIILISDTAAFEPAHSGALYLNPDSLSYFTGIANHKRNIG